MSALWEAGTRLIDGGCPEGWPSWVWPIVVVLIIAGLLTASAIWLMVMTMVAFVRVCFFILMTLLKIF